MRQEYCEACQGEGIIYLGHPNEPYPMRGPECPECDGKGFILIGHHIHVRELIGPYGRYTEASCGGIKTTGEWAGEAIDELTAQMQDRRAA